MRWWRRRSRRPGGAKAGEGGLGAWGVGYMRMRMVLVLSYRASFSWAAKAPGSTGSDERSPDVFACQIGTDSDHSGRRARRRRNRDPPARRQHLERDRVRDQRRCQVARPAVPQRVQHSWPEGEDRRELGSRRGCLRRGGRVHRGSARALRRGRPLPPPRSRPLGALGGRLGFFQPGLRVGLFFAGPLERRGGLVHAALGALGLALCPAQLAFQLGHLLLPGPVERLRLADRRPRPLPLLGGGLRRLVGRRFGGAPLLAPRRALT